MIEKLAGSIPGLGWIVWVKNHWKMIGFFLAIGGAFAGGWKAKSVIVERKELAVKAADEGKRADVAERRLEIANSPDADVDAVAEWLSGKR